MDNTTHTTPTAAAKTDNDIARCTACFAAPGQPCKTRGGKIVKGGHLARWRATRAMLAAREEQRLASVQGEEFRATLLGNLDIIAKMAGR